MCAVSPDSSRPALTGSVDGTAAPEEDLEQVEAASLGQLAQLARRGHLVVPKLAALSGERLRHLRVLLPHGVAQWRAAPPVLRVDVSPPGEEQFTNRQVARR